MGGGGGGGDTQDGKRGGSAGMEASAHEARLIYYPITLTSVTWRCSSIKSSWPGMPYTDPLLNDPSVCLCFSPLCFSCHLFALSFQLY